MPSVVSRLTGMGIVKIAVLAVWLITTITGYRLPDNIQPISYDVKFKVNVEEPFTFEGSVNIEAHVAKETDSIVLHSNGLNITQEITVDGTTYNHSLSDDNRHFLTITLDSLLTANTDTNISIHFNGELSEDMYGFYKSNYVNELSETVYLAATQFQPTHARRVFPCFDEPQLKAKFNFELTVPSKYEALGNTPVETGYPQDDEDDADWKVYKFKETDLMSTYLIAFVVSDFKQKTDPSLKYSFSAWARSEAINKADYSQDVGPKLVDWFEDYTAIDYTFEKIDQVALPDFAAGAMENWGLITYRETGLLYYDEASTEANKKSIATVIAHELAHMWFGNLITLEWWSYTWLNEGFARYFQYLSTNGVETDWRLMDQFLVDQQHAIFGTDSLASAQALTSDCETPAQISAKFTSISYSKGGSILRMLSHILTPRTFQEAIKNYLNDHKESNTNPGHLFDALERQRLNDGTAEHSVQDFLTLWTEQPGYPVINVDRRGTTFRVTQERFLLRADDLPPPQPNWWVPLTWTKQSDASSGFARTQPTDWLDGITSKYIEIQAQDSEWVIFNNQETGYYRVNYDSRSWDLIIRSLHDNKENIHVLNRAQLLDDSLNLARAGRLHYAIALDIVDYLENEDDYIPWASALSSLSFLDRKLVSEEGYEDFKIYISSLLSKIYGLLGFDVGASDNHITHLHRSSVLSWLCRFNNEDCVKQATDQFDAYLNDKSNLVHANLRSVVYCTALRHGGQEEWDFLWNVYSNSRIATEKVVILSALGCTENEEILKQYLQKSIDENSGIKRQDASSVFSAVYSNPKGVSVAFEFLTAHYMEISEYYGSMNALSNILTGIAGRLTTEAEVIRLEEFINNNSGDLGSAAEAGRNAIEAARADMEWTNTHKSGILTWLRYKLNPPTDPPTSTIPPTPTTPPASTTPTTSTTPPASTTPTTSTTLQTSTSPSSSVPTSTVPTTTEDSASALSHSIITTFTIVLVCLFMKQLMMH